MKCKNYLEKNGGEVKDMIKNYIMEVLVAKPDDVLQFSIDYFEQFEEMSKTVKA